MIRYGDSLAAFGDQLQQSDPYVRLASAATEQAFDAAFWLILEEKLSHLEKIKKVFAPLAEDGLTALLVSSLCFHGLHTTREQNSNGHVDITSVGGFAPKRVKLGEAKIYRGPKYHVNGIHQLLARYTTGRETTGYLLIYVRQRNIKRITLRLRELLNKYRPKKQIGNCRNHSLKWSFTTQHKHNSGETLSLAHVGCNLYIEKEE